MKLFLLTMERLFLTTRTIFLDFHPIRMRLFVFRHLIVFFPAFVASQGELYSHSKTSNQSLVYFIIKVQKKQAKYHRISYFFGTQGKNTDVLAA